MKYILTLILFFCVNFALSQKKIPEHYNHPFEFSYEPLTIRINAIVLKRDDGTGNFDLKNEKEKKLLEEYLDQITYRYRTLIQPEPLEGCYSGTDFFSDAKLNFKYKIIEVKNSYYWNYLNSGSLPEERKYAGFSPTENWYIKPLDDSIVALKQPKAINIYLTQNAKFFDERVQKRGGGTSLSGEMAAQQPSSTDLYRSSQVHAPNVYISYLRLRYQAVKEFKTTWDETKYWWFNSGLPHEIGHNLGLNHSNEYHRANKCKYAMMSQGGTDPRNYIQPTEIKKMHWNLTRTNLMQFVTEDSHYGVTWPIDKDTIWDKPRRFYNNFEIARDVTLTISDSIVLPPQAFMKLNKNSKIVLTGKGKITDAYGKEFKSFDKHKSAKILKQ